MIRPIAAALLLALAGCGGGRPLPAPPPAPVTIPDLMAYAVQSRGTNGDASTPLLADDPMIYRRFDFGHYQATDSFLVGPTEAITAWSYAPWGAFDAAHGDGGERYQLQGDALRITDTQDGGKPGVQHFLMPWTVATRQTVDCAQGWTRYSPIDRGCRTVVDYPVIGPVDTIISEHGDGAAKERIFLGLGWGRLAWQAFDKTRTPPADLAARCPDFGWNALLDGLRLTDCRIAVNIEPADGKLTGAQLWRP